MFIVFTVLMIIICILTILIVLVQNSKGGGLAANFSSNNQIMGVRRTTDFLEKATWTLGAALIVISLLAGITLPQSDTSRDTMLQGQFDEGAAMQQNATDNLVIPDPVGEPSDQGGQE